MNFEGINRFGRMLREEISRVSERGEALLEIGEILPDWSLRTNGFQKPVPAGDYLICRSLAIGPSGGLLSKTRPGQGSHPHGPSGEHGGHTPASSQQGRHGHPGTEGRHEHDVLIPDKLRTVRPGDRVLVAWAGNDAVVVDLVYPAEEVL